MSAVTASRNRHARLAWWALALAIVAALVYLMATASTGPVDPTEVRGQQSHGTVVFNSAIIVFREGLEAVLIFAAVTASFLGANRERRRPVVAGAVVAFGAAVATWFVAQALLDAFSSLGGRLEAITGFLAIAVLLVVMNWFVHKVYWSEWIGRHHRQRRRLLASTGVGATLGLVALGFTSVYREGFEVVLFLQSLELQAGTATVLEGVGLGLAGTAVVGLLTFWLHHKLPYKRMLVLTGVLLGVVLVVMVGGTAAKFQELGWLPMHALPVTLPGWLGAWFEIYSTWEGIACQVVAAVFVVGSYLLAEHVKVRRPQQRGEAPAQRAEAPPAAIAAGAGPRERVPAVL
jgi:high-affinity iron transporter